MTQHSRWTNRQVRQLHALLDSGVSPAELAKKFSRTRLSVMAKIRLSKYQPLCSECGARYKARANTTRCKTCMVSVRKQKARDHANAHNAVNRHKSNFSGNLQAVLSRDMHKCQTCYRTHHEVPLTVCYVQAEPKNNAMSNLTTKCQDCAQQER